MTPWLTLGAGNARQRRRSHSPKRGVDEWSVLVVGSEVALVGEEASERVLEGAASDSVLVRDAAAGGCLAVGEREQHDPLDSAQPSQTA